MIETSTVTRPDASVSPPPAVGQQHRAQQFRVSPCAVQWMLMGGAALLVGAYLISAVNHHHLGINFFGANFLYRIFDLTGEVTVPTWYSSSLLLPAALILAVISIVTLRSGQQYGRHWAGLSLLFLAFSIDEAADVHGSVSHKMSDTFDLGGPLTYPWVIPGMIFTLIVGALYARFMRDLRDATRRRFLLAGGLFVAGALAIEAVEAAYDSRFEATAPYIVMVAVEEALEFAGVILFISALLSHAGSLGSRLQISITSEAEPLTDEP